MESSGYQLSFETKKSRIMLKHLWENRIWSWLPHHKKLLKSSEENNKLRLYKIDFNLNYIILQCNHDGILEPYHSLFYRPDPRTKVLDLLIITLNIEFKFKVNRSLTTRYRNSAIPQMQRMLNLHERQKQKIMKKISMPVNHGFCKSLSLR